MNKIVKNFINHPFIKHPLFSGSAILMIGNLLGNATNYFFHLITGRILGPSTYSILASLMSLLYYIGVLSSVFLTTIMRQAAKFSVAEKKAEKENFVVFYKKISCQIFNFCLFFLIIYFLLSNNVARFLKINDIFLIWQVGLLGFLSLLIIPNFAFLQARLDFLYLSGLAVISGILKIVFTLLVFVIGGTLINVLWGLIIASIFGFLLSFIPLIKLTKNMVKKNRGLPFSFGKFWSGSLPIFLSVLGTTSLYTSDLVLVKHFLPEREAGLYASLSVLGKIIFFLSSPILTVMMPLVVRNKKLGRDFLKPLSLTLFIVASACLGMTVVYFLFPKPIIWLLYGKDYFAVAPFLGAFSLFITFYSLATVLINFYLALDDKFIGFFPAVAAAIQIFLISIFHQNFQEVIAVSMLTMIGLFISLLFYSFYFRKYFFFRKHFLIFLKNT